MAETNIKFLKENHLYEAHKQFMRMAEGFGYSVPIEEAGEEEDPQNVNADASMGGNNQEPQMDGADNGLNMGGEPNDNMADPNEPNMPNDNNPMPMDNTQPPMDEVPLDDSDSEDDKESDEEVIDVDDVVKAQEKTNDKVNDVGRDLGTVDKRIEKLLGALENMQSVIDKNNAEIADLKNEFEKRNPTQTERLNLRTLDSYPFSVRPDSYWKEKAANSNYEAYSNNEEPTTKEYKITNDDVRNVSDDIANTFDIPEDSIQDFKKIFDL